MKKLLVGLLAVTSMSAFSHDKVCIEAYKAKAVDRTMLHVSLGVTPMIAGITVAIATPVTWPLLLTVGGSVAAGSALESLEVSNQFAKTAEALNLSRGYYGIHHKPFKDLAEKIKKQTYKDHKITLTNLQVAALLNDVSESQKICPLVRVKKNGVQKRAVFTRRALVKYISHLAADVTATVQSQIDNRNSSEGQFSYKLLRQFSKPCGLEGSVDERIKDCSYQLSSARESFVLVARTEGLKEVYKELSTGLLWSDTLPQMITREMRETACDSIQKETAGITSVTWTIPSVEDYQEAEKSGIREALPNMETPLGYWRHFITSSPYKIPDMPEYDDSNLFQIFDGRTGETDYYMHSEKFLAKCVGR